jgi:hypothetical protein
MHSLSKATQKQCAKCSESPHQGKSEYFIVCSLSCLSIICEQSILTSMINIILHLTTIQNLLLPRTIKSMSASKPTFFTVMLMDYYFFMNSFFECYIFAKNMFWLPMLTFSTSSPHLREIIIRQVPHTTIYPYYPCII